MRKVETCCSFPRSCPSKSVKPLLATLTGVIERETGVVLTADHWGMRDLAYPVRKQMRGYYVRLEYVAPVDFVAELERIIRITDGIVQVHHRQAGRRSGRAHPAL